MPRRKPLTIALSSKDSLEELLRDILHDSLTLKNHVIREINIINNSVEIDTTSDIYQLGKVKSNLLSLLNTNSGNKIAVAKLLASMIDSFEIDKVDESKVSLSDFSAIRQMLKDQNNKKDD